MVRRRRSYRRRTYKVQKYSNETAIGNIKYVQPIDDATIHSYAAIVIDNTSIQGMRKVKNFTLQLQSQTLDPLSWALVYVPQGTRVSNMSATHGPNTVSIYEPNQNVIMSGLISSANGVVTKRTRLARNLNSGDLICLVCACMFTNGRNPANPGEEEDEPDPVTRATGDGNDTVANLSFVCNYAITF